MMYDYRVVVIDKPTGLIMHQVKFNEDRDKAWRWYNEFLANNEIPETYEIQIQYRSVSDWMQENVIGTVTLTRVLTVVDTFEIPGRGTTYCVKAPGSGAPYHMGEIVFIDNVLYKITGVEMMMSNPPQPIYRGYQNIMLERIG